MGFLGPETCGAGSGISALEIKRSPKCPYEAIKKADRIVGFFSGELPRKEAILRRRY
jgi:hypothetical protein